MTAKICIIGSGPAGLFTAIKLVRHGVDDIVMFEKNSVSFGGLMNDCKLNFDHRIGMDIEELQLTESEVYQHLAEIKEVFKNSGYCTKVTDPNAPEIKKWIDRFAAHDMELVVAEQFHCGSDNAKHLIRYLIGFLEDKVELRKRTGIEEIEFDGEKFTLKDSYGDEHFCDILVVTPGRSGAYWFREQARKLGIKFRFGEIDVGLRVELNAKVLDPLTSKIYDPKVKYLTKKYRDKVRTFCVNPHGRVRLEHYDGFKLVNGDALMKHKTPNTNFAILQTIKLTEPLADTTRYGRFIAYSVNLLGDNTPIAQRLGDLKRGRRSKKSNFYDSTRYDCMPTLKLITVGDISLSYPKRIMDNLLEFMEQLDKVLPGIMSDSTILYAPEIKFYDTRYLTDKNLKVEGFENLFIGGDGVGKSRGIVGASLNGLMIAEGILKLLGKN